jgi:hypothetical protein
MRIGQNLGKHGHQSASQTKEELSAAVIASSISGPKTHRKTMFPMMCDQLPCMNIAVDGDPVMAGNDLRRNGGPLQDECVTTHQLKQKNEDVHHDNERSDHRQSHWTSRDIA